MIFQPTGCTGDTPRTDWSTAASGRPSLVHVHPHSFSGSSQGLHQTIRRQRHAALVTLWQLVMVLASSAKIGTGFCTGTSRPVDDSACGGQKGSIIIFGRTFIFFLSVMILISDSLIESVRAIIYLMPQQGQRTSQITHLFNNSPVKRGPCCCAYRVIEPINKFTTHKPTDKKVLLHQRCVPALQPSATARLGGESIRDLMTKQKMLNFTANQ